MLSALNLPSELQVCPHPQTHRVGVFWSQNPAGLTVSQANILLEGISLNIVENATSDKISKGDLRKAWGRLERRWNPKTREDIVEVYTKFLNYKLENTRKKPMDWLAFLEKNEQNWQILGIRWMMKHPLPTY